MKGFFVKDRQFYKFCLYGFLKNLRFYEPFLLVYLLNKLDGNYVQALSLYSIRFVIRTILEIPSGIIADALGRKGSLLFAYIFYILSFLTYYLAENYFWFLIPTILFSIGDAFRTGTHKAMIIEYLKIQGWLNARTTYYGYTRSWSQAGSAISSILAALIIIFAKNYDIIFLATILPYLIGIFLLISYPKELDKEFVSNGSVVKNMKMSLTESWNSLKKYQSITLLCNTSFYSGFHNAVKDLLQPVILSTILIFPINFHLDQQQKAALYLGLFYFAIYLLSAIASRNAGTIGGYFKNSISAIKNLSLLGIILCLVISLLVFMNLPIYAALLFLPFFPVLSIQRPSVVSHISNKIKGKIMATTLSVESQFGSLTAAVLALLIGILIEKFGLGIGLGIVSLLALIIALILAKINEKNEKNNS